MRTSYWFICGIFLSLAVIIALIFFSAPSQQTQQALASSQGTLSLATEIYDFGTISMQNGLVRTQTILSNTSSEAVTVFNLYTSCMCTEVSLTHNTSSYGPFGMPGHKTASSTPFRAVIQPGDTATIDIVFDPAAHGPEGTGPLKRLVFIETNSAASPQRIFTFHANVTP